MTTQSWLTARFRSLKTDLGNPHFLDDVQNADYGLVVCLSSAPHDQGRISQFTNQRTNTNRPHTIKPRKIESRRNRRLVRLLERRTPGKRALVIRSIPELLGRLALIKAICHPYGAKGEIAQLRSDTEDIRFGVPASVGLAHQGLLHSVFRSRRGAEVPSHKLLKIHHFAVRCATTDSLALR